MAIVSPPGVALLIYAMASTKKRLLLLSLGVTFLLVWLVWAIPSEATLHLYYVEQGPATVYIDDQAVLQLTDATPWFSRHQVRLRSGLHTLAVRHKGTLVSTWFLYLHVNSVVVEYTPTARGNEHTFYAMEHIGKFLWD